MDQFVQLFASFFLIDTETVTFAKIKQEYAIKTNEIKPMCVFIIEQQISAMKLIRFRFLESVVFPLGSQLIRVRKRTDP